MQSCRFCGKYFKNIHSVRRHEFRCPLRKYEEESFGKEFEKLRLVIVACRAFSDPNFRPKLDNELKRELIKISDLLRKQNEKAKSGSVAWFLERLERIL